MKFNVAIAIFFAFSLSAVGCSVNPPRPMYTPKVGWTKERVLQDSIYRSSPRNVMRTSTSRGTIETWAFGEPPYAFIHFDESGKVKMINCLRYCQ